MLTVHVFAVNISNVCLGSPLFRRWLQTHYNVLCVQALACGLHPALSDLHILVSVFIAASLTFLAPAQAPHFQYCEYVVPPSPHKG